MCRVCSVSIYVYVDTSGDHREPASTGVSQAQRTLARKLLFCTSLPRFMPRYIIRSSGLLQPRGFHTLVEPRPRFASILSHRASSAIPRHFYLPASFSRVRGGHIDLWKPRLPRPQQDNAHLVVETWPMLACVPEGCRRGLQPPLGLQPRHVNLSHSLVIFSLLLVLSPTHSLSLYHVFFFSF